MAMQAGMGISRLIFCTGVGCTGMILMRNTKLSDILAELQKLVTRIENSDDTDVDPLALKVQQLAEEIRRIASRPIPIITDNSDNLVSLAKPVAAMGVLGYGYMRWKGLSLSDLMYVTRHSMATAVSNLTKNLDNVSEILAATKRHLTKRIGDLDEKLDEQVEVSRLVRDEVSDVRVDLSHIGVDLERLQMLVSSLDDKLLSLERKQDLANVGVTYLCNVVSGRQANMPEMLQEQLKIGGTTSLGLKELALETY